MKRSVCKSRMYFLTLVMAALTGLSWVGGAQALTLTGVACDGHGTGMISQPGYVDCSGAWSGNNSNQAADVATQIHTDWNLNNLLTTDVTGELSRSPLKYSERFHG